jgi:transcriptional regulator with XRE-family HTH domain
MKSIYSSQSKKFAERIRTARLKGGLSQKQAAEALSCSQSYISKVETGQARLDIVQLKEFARVYGVSFRELSK